MIYRMQDDTLNNFSSVSLQIALIITLLGWHHIHSKSVHQIYYNSLDTKRLRKIIFWISICRYPFNAAGWYYEDDCSEELLYWVCYSPLQNAIHIMLEHPSLNMSSTLDCVIFYRNIYLIRCPLSLRTTFLLENIIIPIQQNLYNYFNLWETIVL